MTTPISLTRLRLTLSASEPSWSVPADYYRHLRSAVYGLLRKSDADLADFLHEHGFSAERPAVTWRPGALDDSASQAPERFKLFCFSGLIGPGRIRRGRLVFGAEPVLWFFATPVAATARALAAALRQAGRLRIGRTTLKIDTLDVLDAPPIASPMTCRLLSPLVVSCPEPTRRQRRYLLIGDDVTLIAARLRHNLLAKHRALYGCDPPEADLEFQWDERIETWPATDRPTRLVRLSASGEPAIRVRGSLGGVRLSGSAALLRIALYCGLGQFNAAGMGFLLPEAENHLLRS